MNEFPQMIAVNSDKHSDFIDITFEVAQQIPPNFNGICHLFCQHTTAGLTINENADPDVIHDLLLDLKRLVPWNNPKYLHGEGNSAAHLKASLMGCELSIPVVNGKLRLGTWQGIYFSEFDGPRSRKVLLQLTAGVC